MIGPPREMTIRAAGKIWIGHQRKTGERTRRLIDQRGVIRAFIILRQRVKTVLKSVRSRELAVKRVETPVFLVDHNDVPQPLHRVLAALAVVVWRTGKSTTGVSEEDCRSCRHSGNAFREIDE